MRVMIGYWVMADMKFMVMGVHAQTTALDVREHFAIPQELIPSLLTDLVKTTPSIHEAMILTTCNRTELYVALDDTEAAMAALHQFWVRQRNVPLTVVNQHTFVYLNQDAILHLFRVAAGLDSLIVGESQIMAQVKDAWQLAQRADTAPYFLDKLVNTALAVSKRVRSETGIEQKDTSVSHAAVQYLQHRAPNHLQKPIVVIGGGKVAEQLLVHLVDNNHLVSVVNRSQERLNQLIQSYGVFGTTWDQLPALLQTAKTVFVATGAPHVVIDADTLANVTHPLWVFDLSVPRNVCDSVASRPNTVLVNVDDLGVEQTNNLHQIEDVAERLISDGYTQFEQWRHSLPVLPTLARFRNKLEQMRLEQLSEISAEYKPLVDQFSRSLINKILHAPTVRLKQTRESQPHLEQLFDLVEK
jgi:glutamyl-tRNA reductase